MSAPIVDKNRLKAYYSEGYAAAKAGVSASPYCPGSIADTEWTRGWTDSDSLRSFFALADKALQEAKAGR